MTKIILYTIGFIVGIPALMAYYGWAITVLWGWFMVPAFGLAPLSLKTAIGASFIIHLARPVIHPDSNPGDYTKTMIILFSPLISLSLGWLTKAVLP